MVPGGIDLVFYTPRSVDALEVVTRNFKAIWPELVVTADSTFDCKGEYFIDKTKELADRDDYFGDNTFIHLLFEDKGQTVAHYMQEVTIVLDELTDEMLRVINAIQTEFLAGYRGVSKNAQAEFELKQITEPTHVQLENLGQGQPLGLDD